MINDPENVTDGLVLRPAPKVGHTGDVRTFSSEQLFDGHREIFITHEDRTYRLRITSQSKLILTL